jgi:nucleotide-binding universal stress UspA family protein
MTVTAILGGAPDQCPAHIQTAIAIAKKLGSPLQGLLAMPDPANAAVYFVAGEMVMSGPASIAAIQESQDETKAAFQTAFAAETAKAGSWLNADFAYRTGFLNDVITANSVLADATVFPKGAAQGGHALGPSFEHVLMDERMPIILASDDGSVHGPALIAWDGSARAMRAIRAHLPLLKSLEHATIATRTRDDNTAANQETSPEALADLLRDERIETKIERFDGKVSDGLMSLTQKHNAGLVVMGAYGHSRIGQMLFGGTSKAMFAAKDSPALALAH